MQAQNINLVCEGTLEITGLETADINDKGQILARTKVDDRFLIRVMNRFSGKVSSEFPSECEHAFACLIANPTDAGFVLESCLKCHAIRNYNIHTVQSSIVYIGDAPDGICHGPIGYFLAHRSHSGLSIFKWDQKRRKLHCNKSMFLEGRLMQMCCSELCNMLVGVYEHKEIKAVRLEREADTLKLSVPIWKLFRVIDGWVIEPDALTSDKRGNVYIGDGVEQQDHKDQQFDWNSSEYLSSGRRKQRGIRDLFWSDTEPNLIVRRGDRIISYCIPKSD